MANFAPEVVGGLLEGASCDGCGRTHCSLTAGVEAAGGHRLCPCCKVTRRQVGS